jgi:hypothetical protein
MSAALRADGSASFRFAISERPFVRDEAQESRQPQRMTFTMVYHIIFRSIQTQETGPEKRKARRNGRTSQIVCYEGRQSLTAPKNLWRQ